MKQLDKILDSINLVTTIVFFISVLIMVLIQGFAVITLNGELAINISNLIAKPASMVAAVSAIISIVLAYIRGEMKAS